MDVFEAILLADMMHWDEGGWFWMALMMMIGTIAVAAIVGLLVYLLIKGSPGQGSQGGQGPYGKQGETPLDVAKRRYASGEITREQFEEIRKALE